MKIQILKFSPEKIEYFVDSKHPKLIKVFGWSHCVFIDLHQIVRFTYFLKEGYTEIHQLKLGWIDPENYK